MSKPFADDYATQIALIDPNKPVRCYRNIHKKCWSVKQGIVRFHCHKIFLKNVKFLVNERLRQRVVAEKRKNVHAFVMGEITDTPQYFTINKDAISIHYNPYKHSTFVCGHASIYQASLCCLFKYLDTMHTAVDLVSARYAKLMNKPLDTCEACDKMYETVELCLL